MNFFKYLMFIILIEYINSDQCDEFTGIPSQVSDCKDKLSQVQIDSNLKAYCCYSKNDVRPNAQCVSLTKEQYDNIKDYIRFNKILWGEVNLSIDCKSLYLYLGISNLLLFILFIL